MAPSPDYSQRGVSGKKMTKSQRVQKHANKPGLHFSQITDTDKSVCPSLSLISAPVFGVSREVKCVTLGPDGSPAGWGPCCRKSLYCAVPPSHCWRTTSHCTLITEYLNTYAQPQIKIHKQSGNKAAWWSEELSHNWTHVQTRVSWWSILEQGTGRFITHCKSHYDKSTTQVPKM